VALKSSIEWTEATWNPVTGCTKISTGCLNCYAARMARRLKDTGMLKYQNGFTLSLHPDVLPEPLTWRKPQMIFTCSMSDLLHKDVPTSFIQEVVDVMQQADWHKFQILTKRAERLVELKDIVVWPQNAWVGVTIENNDYLFRADYLRQIVAPVKFLSIEPLIGPVSSLNLQGIDWVIVGGESGPGARPIEEEWVCQIKDLCLEADVPFFFKQWGGVFKKRNGRTLNGRTWDAMPYRYVQEKAFAV
jgi:protein gp37